MSVMRLKLIIFMLILPVVTLPAQEKTKKPTTDWKQTMQMSQQERKARMENKDIDNPHWNSKACLACHTRNRGTSKNLRKSA